MDEKLKFTLDKIVLLTKQNPEFGKELRKALGIGSSANSVDKNKDQISHIEKYLGLDYYVDDQPSLIDYSFIKEPAVRAQLISDNREMMRFRYGTRYHAISFVEFCRFAHLQAEMLLNYYYDKSDGDIKSIKDHLKKFNPTTNLSEMASLGAIPYNSKLWAFKTEHPMDIRYTSIFDYLRKVRNESSHRSPEEEDVSISKYRKNLVNMGMPLTQEGFVATSKLEEGSSKALLYGNMIKNSDWYKEYKYLLWLHEEGFDKVIDAIEELKNKIQQAL